jgi:hypothetical protein
MSHFKTTPTHQSGEYNYDDARYWSDTEEAKYHKDIMRNAHKTDFDEEGDDDTLDDFEYAFKERRHYKTLLHRLARLPFDHFCAINGPGLLFWVMTKYSELLCEGDGGDPVQQYPLHAAIESSNADFLDIVLDISDELKISIAKALAVTDRTGRNCLHGAIDKKLPCAARMIAKSCKKTLKKPDSYQYTPLHIAMTKESRGWPARTAVNTNRARTSANMSKTRKTGRDDQSDHQAEAQATRSFAANEVLNAMETYPHVDEVSKSRFLVQLLTATDNRGWSPYQLRCHQAEKTKQMRNEKEISSQERLFQTHFKNLIFNSLAEIPDIRKALYGTEGYSEPSQTLDAK